jgi:hypothetical protein
MWPNVKRIIHIGIDIRVKINLPLSYPTTFDDGYVAGFKNQDRTFTPENLDHYNLTTICNLVWF